MQTYRRGVLTALAMALMLLLAACGSEGSDTEIATADEVTTDSESETTDSEAAGAASESEVADPADEVATVEEVEEQVQVAPSTTVAESAAVEKTATTEAAAVSTTEAVVEEFVPQPGPGLGAFALRVFESGELGFSPAEQGCVDGRRQAELRVDRTVPDATLTLDQQAISIEILLDCASSRLESVFLDEFEVTPEMAALGFDETFGACIFRELSRDDELQPQALRAIVHVTADEPVPEDTIDPGARVMARCVDIGELLANTFGSAPELAALIDLDCVRSLDEDAAVALFAGSFRDPDSEDPAVRADSFRAIRPCMQFGQLMADSFAPQATLTAAEISCIDAAFDTDEVFDAMIAGADLPPSANDALLACLSPATLQALGG